MRHLLLGVCLLCCPLVATEARAQVSVGFTVTTYPTLVPVPGYPVYYDPHMDTNYFFYDGLYWVFVNDNWYASSWYNGPWRVVVPESVPLFVLRIPVRYYRAPPVYFRAWRVDAPPRWGEHWGTAWEERRRGWDHWDHRAVPAPAPLPVYQRQYAGARYPRAPEEQHAIRTENYHYQPHGAVAQQHFEQPGHQASTHGEARPPPPRHAEGKGVGKNGEEHGLEHH
jgi:hypothetical protein